MQLIVASTNTQKVLQLKSMLKELRPTLEIRSLFDFPQCRPEANFDHSPLDRACHIASTAASALSLTCLSEQWQLVIPSLANKPVFAPGASCAAHTKCILGLLENAQDFERSAYIESSICCANPAGKIYKATARIEGLIAETERGKASVDFENIFIKHDYQKTLAELSESTRWRISARRKALEKLSIYLEALQ